MSSQSCRVSRIAEPTSRLARLSRSKEPERGSKRAGSNAWPSGERRNRNAWACSRGRTGRSRSERARSKERALHRPGRTGRARRRERAHKRGPARSKEQALRSRRAQPRSTSARKPKHSTCPSCSRTDRPQLGRQPTGRRPKQQRKRKRSSSLVSPSNGSCRLAPVPGGHSNSTADDRPVASRNPMHDCLRLVRVTAATAAGPEPTGMSTATLPIRTTFRSGALKLARPGGL
jgi:hypothetical protein